MDCSVPPPLSDEQIMAVLNGEEGLEERHHLERCPECQKRVDEARQMEAMLMGVLFRKDCPSSQMLTDYHFKMLEDTVHFEVRDHLNHCRHCTTDLAQLVDFLQNNPPPVTTPVQHPRGILARLGDIIAQFIPPTPQAAFRGSQGLATRPIFRGNTPESLTFEANGLTIFLDIESTPKGFVLHGQLVANERNQADWIYAMVEVLQNGTIQSVASVDDMNMFLCDLIERSTLELRIVSTVGQRVLIQNITFDE